MVGLEAMNEPEVHAALSQQLAPECGRRKTRNQVSGKGTEEWHQQQICNLACYAAADVEQQNQAGCANANSPHHGIPSDLMDLLAYGSERIKAGTGNAHKKAAVVFRQHDDVVEVVVALEPDEMR